VTQSLSAADRLPADRSAHPDGLKPSGANLAARLSDAYLAVRNETERRAAPLSPEDQVVQSMPDASPAKWHRAHTTWFFEQFLLGPHCPGYRPFDPDYAFLFNSYYVSAGPRHARGERGHLTRPGAAEVTAYRRHVDTAVLKFFNEAGADKLAELAPLVEVGLNHEQQHQELMLTDILHEPALSGLQSGLDAAPLDPQRRSVVRIAGRHSQHRPRRRDVSFRQREAGAPRAGGPGETGAAPRH